MKNSPHISILFRQCERWVESVWWKTPRLFIAPKVLFFWLYIQLISWIKIRSIKVHNFAAIFYKTYCLNHIECEFIHFCIIIYDHSGSFEMLFRIYMAITWIIIYIQVYFQNNNPETNRSIYSDKDRTLNQSIHLWSLNWRYYDSLNFWNQNICMKNHSNVWNDNEIVDCSHSRI